MTERTYTVAELDALREMVENKYLYGSYCPRCIEGEGISSRAYKEADKTACVEHLVRTHMLAGHTAADLLASKRDSD